LQGLLLMATEVLPQKFAKWHDTWNEWQRWLSKSRLTPLQACLRYCLSFTEVDRVVVGVDSAAQLKQLVIASDGTLADLPDFPALQDCRVTNPARWNEL
jgi:hypothetical protein